MVTPITKTAKIGKVTVGGTTHLTPPVLIGTIFYERHNILIDPMKGLFKEEEARKLIEVQDELSKKTGLPCMIDVVGQTAEAFAREIEFVAGVSEAPILLDGSVAGPKMEAIKHVAEIGLLDRVVYNSLSVVGPKEEFQTLQDVGAENAVFLVHNPVNMFFAGRVKAAKELMQKGDEIKIKNRLIDAAIIDVPSLGTAFKFIDYGKKEFGYPVGCSPHNAISTWKGLGKKFAGASDVCGSAACAAAAARGADFLLYGPIKHAPHIFPACAMVTAAAGYSFVEEGKMLPRDHPLFLIP